jgi:hypothetical protein
VPVCEHGRFRSPRILGSNVHFISVLNNPSFFVASVRAVERWNFHARTASPNTGAVIRFFKEFCSSNGGERVVGGTWPPQFNAGNRKVTSEKGLKNSSIWLKS